jgi:hypothetical protein
MCWKILTTKYGDLDKSVIFEATNYISKSLKTTLGKAQSWTTFFRSKAMAKRNNQCILRPVWWPPPPTLKWWQPKWSIHRKHPLLQLPRPKRGSFQCILTAVYVIRACLGLYRWFLHVLQMSKHKFRSYCAIPLLDGYTDCRPIVRLIWPSGIFCRYFIIIVGITI